MAGWVKLDEGFFLHPKALAAGRDARDLYLAALCWSNQQRTDGLIPAYALPMVASFAGVADADQAATRLVEVELWENHVDGWVIHDFLAYQQSREHREAWLEREKARKRAARDARIAREMQDSVRVESTRNPRDVHSRDVDVDVDVDVSTSSSSSDLIQQSYPQAPDDDERIINEVLETASQALAATNARTNPQGYARTVAAEPKRRTQIKALLAAHPGRDAHWLTDEYLGRTHPPDKCTNCGALYHTADRCPLGDQP